MHGAVTTIEARSPTGGKLIYSISAGDIYGEFAVDFNTGNVLSYRSVVKLLSTVLPGYPIYSENLYMV